MHIGVGISQNKRGKHVMKNMVGNVYGSHCSGVCGNADVRVCGCRLRGYVSMRMRTYPLPRFFKFFT